MSHFYPSLWTTRKKNILYPLQEEGKRNSHLISYHLHKKHLLNGANTSKSCTAEEERNYIKYGLYCQISVGGFGD